jgi:hypothetical protein
LDFVPSSSRNFSRRLALSIIRLLCDQTGLLKEEAKAKHGDEELQEEEAS